MHKNLIFIEKHHFSSFRASTLDSLLRLHSIDQLYIAGINTEICVLKTSLDAFERSYRVRLVKDCVASLHGASGDALGLAALSNFWSVPHGSWAMVTSSQLLRENTFRSWMRGVVFSAALD